MECTCIHHRYDVNLSRCVLNIVKLIKVNRNRFATCLEMKITSMSIVTAIVLRNGEKSSVHQVSLCAIFHHHAIMPRLFTLFLSSNNPLLQITLCILKQKHYANRHSDVERKITTTGNERLLASS